MLLAVSVPAVPDNVLPVLKGSLVGVCDFSVDRKQSHVLFEGLGLCLRYALSADILLGLCCFCTTLQLLRGHMISQHEMCRLVWTSIVCLGVCVSIPSHMINR